MVLSYLIVYLSKYLEHETAKEIFRSWSQANGGLFNKLVVAFDGAYCERPEICRPQKIVQGI